MEEVSGVFWKVWPDTNVNAFKGSRSKSKTQLKSKREAMKGKSNRMNVKSREEKSREKKKDSRKSCVTENVVEAVKK